MTNLKSMLKEFEEKLNDDRIIGGIIKRMLLNKSEQLEERVFNVYVNRIERIIEEIYKNKKLELPPKDETLPIPIYINAGIINSDLYEYFKNKKIPLKTQMELRAIIGALILAKRYYDTISEYFESKHRSKLKKYGELRDKIYGAAKIGIDLKEQIDN